MHKKVVHNLDILLFNEGKLIQDSIAKFIGVEIQIIYFTNIDFTVLINWFILHKGQD